MSPRPESRRDRVLMLLENNPYPQDIRVRREATTLAKAGYQVTVIAPRGGAQAWTAVVDHVVVYRFPAPPEGNGVVGYVGEYGYALLALLLLSLFAWARRGVDVVHTHNPPDLLVLIAGLFKLAGKRVVFDHHDLAPEMYQVLFTPEPTPLYRLLVAFESLSCRLADHIIVTNDSYRRRDVALRGVSPERVTVVRNGPDPRRLKPAANGSTPHKGPVTLCYVGEMGHHDGLDYLLHALHHLRYELARHDFHAVLVGHGAAYGRLQDLAREVALGDWVTFTGWVPHAAVRDHLLAADICLAPEPSNVYNDQSTMIKIMEYMAVARPIVAFDLPEHRVSAGGAALYARANDVADFATQIAALMDDPARREALGVLGRARVEQTLAWPYQADRLLAAYEAVTAASAPGSR